MWGWERREERKVGRWRLGEVQRGWRESIMIRVSCWAMVSNWTWLIKGEI